MGEEGTFDFVLLYKCDKTLCSLKLSREHVCNKLVLLLLLLKQKKQNTGKGGKKKKQVLKFTLDCTHPVEDGIMDAANFVSPSFIGRTIS